MCWKQASVVIDSNRSRTGEGRADHDGMFCDATVDRDCGSLRCRDTSRIVALLSQQPCSDRGGGNSKIIIAVPAENELLRIGFWWNLCSSNRKDFGSSAL